MRKDFKAIAILVGTTIGAGMFGIPYVISQIGFVPGLIYLLLLGGLVLILNLAYGEVILRTPGDHQIAGYVNVYLGKSREMYNTLVTIVVFTSLYGALLAYLIKIGEFVSLLLGVNAPTIFSFLFFLLAYFIVYYGLKAVSSYQLYLVGFLLILVAVIAVLGVGKIQTENLMGSNLSAILIPYGVLLFALSGNSVIPEMEEVLRKEPKKLKKSIIIGTIIPLLSYLVFAVMVVGVCGRLTSDDAVSGLLLFLPDHIIKLGTVLGILTMGTSFLSSVYILKETWQRDYKVPKKTAFALAAFPALILLLLGANEFIRVLEFSGAISGGLAGILILLMFQEAKKKGKRKPAFSFKIPKILISLLYVVFALGMLSPLFNRL